MSFGLPSSARLSVGREARVARCRGVVIAVRGVMCDVGATRGWGASALARKTFWSTRVGIKMGRGMRVVDEWFLAYAWVRDLDGVRVNTRVYDDGDVEDASASGEAERWSGDATMMEKIGSRRPSSSSSSSSSSVVVMVVVVSGTEVECTRTGATWARSTSSSSLSSA